MQFTVNTKTKTIKPKGMAAFPMPQNILDYFCALDVAENTAGTVLNLEPNFLSLEESKLYFIKREEVSVPASNEDEGESITEYKDTKIFYFDLKDYKPKTLDGSLIKDLNRIRGSVFKINVDDHGCPEYEPHWTIQFFRTWKQLAHYEGTKTKTNWLFKIPEFKLDQLKLAELFLKTGFRCNNILDFVNGSQLDKTATDPASILKIPNRWWKLLLEYSQSHVNPNRATYYFSYFITNVHNLQADNNLDALIDAANNLDCKDLLVEALMETRTIAPKLQVLTTLHNYNLATTVNYLFDLKKQGLSFSEGLSLLEDYSDLVFAVEGDVIEKYPKYLKSMHDIYVIKAKELSFALEDLKCMRAYENKDLTYYTRIPVPDTEGAQYRIDVPSSPADIVEEGREMHHCVATYVQKIANDPNRVVVFLRSGWRYSAPTRHLTIEIYADQIVQARGKYNRDPILQEFRALEEYATHKKLHLSPDLQRMYDDLRSQEEQVAV